MSFTSTAYPFNSTRTIQANSSLGIFPASNYSTSYGTGGDDTLAVQAALNAAASAGGGVAFLPPPVSGSVNISRTPDALAQGLILGSNGVWLIGASPTVTVTIIPGSNLDWLASTGTHGAVDYRTNFSANYTTKTVSAYAYTIYNAALPIGTSKNGGIANIKFVADTTTPTNLGDGIMLNGAMGFQFVNVHFSGFQGDAISLWDCYGTVINTSTGGGTTTGHHIGIHRACYETQVIAANNRTYTLSPITVYTEQYQVPSGPLLTLTPEYTKFVDTHCWTSAAPAQAIDLEGALNVNLTSCTYDGPATLYSTGTRYTAPTNNVLADTGASSGVVSVGTTTPLQNTGTATNPVIAVTPAGTNGYVLTTTGGVVGWASPGASGVTAVTASSPLSSSGGATPNITITSPLPVTNGGTGTATPSLVGGTGITISGAFPNQTVTASGGGGAYDSTVIGQSPTHFWKLNESAGATTAADYGVGTAAPLTNGSTVTFGAPSISNDGETSCFSSGATGTLSMPASCQPTGTFSLSFIMSMTPASGTQLWVFGPASGNFAFGVHSTSEATVYALLNQLNAWYDTATAASSGKTHVCVTYNGSVFYLYINGSPVFSASALFTPVASTTVGTLLGGPGRMAKAALWVGTVITQAQVLAQVSAAGL